MNLLERGQYQHLANVLELKVDQREPLELFEARNAIQIARTSGADRFATETFQKAESNLKQAEDYRARKAGSKPVAMTARQAAVPAFIEQRGVDRRRRAVLKSLLMKAGKDRFPFRGSERPRHMPHGGDRRRDHPKTLPVKRSTGEAESLAGGSHSDRWRKISDSRSHNATDSAIGMPSSIATFFRKSLPVSGCRRSGDVTWIVSTSQAK
jgi:hypothetical protein